MPGRGGRGGGGRNPANQPREVQVSRKVSWLLRHGAGSQGLTLGKGGYVNVQDALNTGTLKALKVTFPELREIVNNNDKQRFSMILASSLDHITEADASSSSEQIQPEAQHNVQESDDPGDYLIRANQGHSIKVDTEGLLTPITVEAGNVPKTVVHGTNESAWNLILKSGGMRRMGRNHMHFAHGLPAGFKPIIEEGSAEEKDKAPVLSGMRTNSTILIYIDIDAALSAGIKFFLSENGVILTEGDENGLLSYKFFKRAESRKVGGGLLMKDGTLPEGVEVDVAAWEKEVGDSRQGRRGGRGGRGGRGRGRGKARVNDDSRDIHADA